MRKILSLGLLFGSVTHVLSAQAGCVALNGWTDKVYNIALPSSITVQNNAAVGTILAEQQVSLTTANSNIMTCTLTTSAIIGDYLNGSTADSSGIIATNVAGVGMRVYFNTSIISAYRLDVSASFVPNVVFYRPEDYFKVQLIKTGPITSGSLAAGRYAAISMDRSYWIATASLPTSINIVNAACSVNQSIINVPMGSVRQSDFKGVGTTTTSIPFSIPLTCNSGARVNVQVDGMADPSNVEGVLALSASSSTTVAAGVGVQLLNGATPVALANASLVGTATSNGLFSVPLSARYYQTGAVVTAGQANATATFTITNN